MMREAMRLGLATLVAGVAAAGTARADTASTSTGAGVSAIQGQQVYQQVCQGCHMANGRGAMGAGAGFPALAGNGKLETSGYPVYVVLNGLGGMPWFNGTLSDAQVAAVVNYIRTSFGNHYTDPVAATDVASVRQPAPSMEK